MLLSCLASWIIAHRYRRRMQRLMRASSPEDSRPLNAPAAEATADRPPGAPVALADNRAAGMRLTVLLIASSCLLAGTSACIFSTLMFPAEPLMPWRVIPIAVLHLWPVIPAITLMWRWSRARFFLALLLWCAATCVVLFAIGRWRQIDMGPLLVLRIMASEIGLSLALLSLVFLGEATRAIAPWLLVPAALLSWSSLAGVQAMVSIGERQPPLLTFLLAVLDPVLGWLPWYGVLLLFVLLPWVLAWWPARVLGRALGRAYAQAVFGSAGDVHRLLGVFADRPGPDGRDAGQRWRGSNRDVPSAAVDSRGDVVRRKVASHQGAAAYAADSAGVSAGRAGAVLVRPRRGAVAPQREHGDDCRNGPR